MHAPLDAAALAADVADAGRCRWCRWPAPRRTGPSYLQRPDLGRRLAEDTELSAGEYDVVLVLADGLSPLAVQSHAVPLVRADARPARRGTGPRVAPVVVAAQARVALGDEIATARSAPQRLVLVGERPGMSSADSLGVYFTYDARRGRRDSERNCLSNIRPPHGTGYEAAATTLVMLMAEANRLRLSGVGLKADPALPG